MPENNNPIKKSDQDKEFEKILKEVFGNKEKIIYDRLKESDNKKTARPLGQQPVSPPQKRPVVAGKNISNRRTPVAGRKPVPNRHPATDNRSGNGSGVKRPVNQQNTRRSGAVPQNRQQHSPQRNPQQRPSQHRNPQQANAQRALPASAEMKKSNRLMTGKDGQRLTRKQIALRMTAIVLAVLLVLSLIVYGIYHFYFSLFGRYSGERNNGEYLYDDSDYTNESDTMTAEQMEAALKKHLAGKATDLMKDKDVMNILLIGEDLRDTEDAERGNTDVMMMISLNNKNKTITMTSFMRDAWVNIEGYGQAKLNAAYWVDGPELLKSTIQDYYGVSIDRYVIVNFESFITIVDTLGGITMDVTDEEAAGMKDPMAEQNNILGNKKGTDYLKKGGKLRLNGNQALAFARLRYVGNADYERTERQRRVITEIIKESKSLSLVKIDKLLKKVLPEVKIDLTEGEMASLLLNCFDYMNYEIQELRIPADGMFSEEIIDGLSVLCPDFYANTREIIKTIYGQEALDKYDQENQQNDNNYGYDNGYYGN